MIFNTKQWLLKHDFYAECPKNIQEQHNFHFEYEANQYKQEKIVEIIDRYIKDYALTETEIQIGFDHVDARKRIYSYKINKTKNQKDWISGGMFGEAILYNILREYFPEAKKMLTKIRKRTATNMEINGFDCAHYEYENNILKLWLGEAKFYNDFSSALTRAYDSLNDHLNVQKISEEFLWLKPDLEISHPEEKKIVTEIMEGTIDNIEFVIPILLTYDTNIPTTFSKKEDFINEIEKDYRDKWSSILKKKFDCISSVITVKFKFILLPFSDVGKVKNLLLERRDASP